MKTTLSNYEIILSLDDSVSLMVNGLYGAIDVVDRDEAAALSEGKVEKLSGEEIERLRSRGHLTDFFETEMDDMQFLAGLFRNIFLNRNMSLLILPSYNCNFRCPYCFERHRLSNGEDWLKKTMSKEMVDKIFSAVEKEEKRGIKVSSCTLYGGEPFLPENREIIEYIVKKAVSSDMTLSVVTNGYSLDHFSDILSEYPFKDFQITLDGIREYNDKRRVYIGGGGSYDKILENIGLVLSKDINVSVRINTGPGNLRSVHELVQVFKENGYSDNNRFSYYYAPADNDNYPGKDYGVSHADIVEDLMQNGFEKKDAMMHVSEYVTDIREISRLLKKESYLKPMDSYCGAENMMYLVDNDGAVYTCWDFAAMDKMRVGRIDMEKEKFAFKFELLKWNFRNVTQMPECKKCPYLFACRGGCASKAYNKTGDLSNPYCGETKEIFCETVSMLCDEQFQKTGERELTKSLKEALSQYTPEDRDTLQTTRDPKLIVELLKKSDMFDLDNTSKADHILWPDFQYIPDNGMIYSYDTQEGDPYGQQPFEQ